MGRPILGTTLQPSTVVSVDEWREPMAMHRIFGFWTGDNPMPEARRACWDTFDITGLVPTMVMPENLVEWVVAEHPLHPAYEFLSSVHRSDYLRAYFMYHHGGGYADIDRQTGSWMPTVARVLRSNRLMGAGYRELKGGTAWLQNNIVDGQVFVLSHAVWPLTAKIVAHAMRCGRSAMIGNGAFYFKPGTLYGRLWLREVERRLDILTPALREKSASHPRTWLGDGTGYPVPWSFLLGDINGPLSL